MRSAIEFDANNWDNEKMSTFGLNIGDVGNKAIHKATHPLKTPVSII